MWLTDRVALVGSGNIGGMGITHPLDCHVYLLNGGAECALIDAGCGMESDRIIAQIAALGVPLERVRHLLLTHTHYDHAGGAATLAQKLGLSITAGAQSTARLEQGDEVSIGLVQAREIGLYPPDAVLPPVKVNRIVGDGDTFQVGEITITAFATPGHSSDHMAYYSGDSPSILFAGDAVFAGGRVALQTLPDCRLDDTFATIRKLAQLKLAMLCPGHGVPVLTDGDAHIRKASACVEAMQVPPAMIF